MTTRLSNLDRLREALKRAERVSALGEMRSEDWHSVKAAARRFLHLAETGIELDWCKPHQSPVEKAGVCDYALENQYCITPCHIVPKFLTDYLTEDAE